MRTRLYNTFSWRKYLIENNNPRIKKFLDSRGYDVFHQICQNMNKAAIYGKDKLITIIHPNSAGAIIIPREDFEEVYDVALSWFLKNEHYEECEIIKQYKINEIKTRTHQINNDKVCV